MLDPLGRRISYLRVSVTDRCDFRCFYCMSDDTIFQPKADLLTLEEMDRLCSAFVARGVRKIRITGGEPLVRRNILSLFRALARHRQSGALDEITLTTNGSRLARHADELAAAGVRRINVSLDSLDPMRFRTITRNGDLGIVLDGLMAAKTAGLRIKVNTVALRGHNDDEYDRLIAWCGEHGFDLTLIETMPLGEIGGDRSEHYLPLSEVKADLATRWTLIEDASYSTGGPSRYVTVAETGRKVGFITPLSRHFCDTCNRVRLTCTGTLFMCLGQDDKADLRTPLRASDDDAVLLAAIDVAIARKPRGHDFVVQMNHGAPMLSRHMNLTGG